MLGVAGAALLPECDAGGDHGNEEEARENSDSLLSVLLLLTPDTQCRRFLFSVRLLLFFASFLKVAVMSVEKGLSGGVDSDYRLVRRGRFVNGG